MIRKATLNDARQICDIYNHYVQTTTITFEEQAVSVHEMQDRIKETTETLPWLVDEDGGTVIGYTYASKWKGRCAYRFAAESTVYLSADSAGKGIGSKLYRQLIAQLHERSIHCIIGGIALPNPASIALHEKLGFKKVAHFSEVGWKFNRWIDVGYWELVLASNNPATPCTTGNLYTKSSTEQQ